MPTNLTDPDVLTRFEVAELGKVAPDTVTDWAWSGKLPEAFRTLGGHRRFRRADVEAFLAARAARAAGGRS